MATRARFTPKGAEYPAANFPQYVLVNRRPVLAFDGATDEECQWTDVAPQGLTGTLSAVVFLIFASATTGTARFQGFVEAVTPGDSLDLDAGDSFDASNSNGVTAPGTAGFLTSVTITLTNADSLVAGDYYRLRIRRDADGTTGTDDIGTDAYVVGVELRDGA